MRELTGTLDEVLVSAARSLDRGDAERLCSIEGTVEGLVVVEEKLKLPCSSWVSEQEERYTTDEHLYTTA
ncbi:hypothetical protein CPLU01_04367 [Colletotrichum plurivorum]|uniref:Uncharacterized protein n=1 Tax=Colletotrichum plurivorum TaxID=2175906 RepID=A0A8H6KPK8_9PEZI|nr:hypothetical protein CPLU01_04367 [Colletotrichum plurivorum]